MTLLVPESKADTFLRETERLQSSKLLTLLEDGWEDRLRRSIYGVVAAGMDSFPIVMSLDDLTGARGNATKCLDIAVSSLTLMGVPTARNFIAATTDNPTTMQAFRRLLQKKYFWLLTFACFLHSLSTLVGEIAAYPLIKKTITQANRTITFFNGSHYWGGQLKTEAKRLHISRGLKKNCESRCVAFHRQPLYIICLRPDAQKKTNGMSTVNSDVITILTRITKPIVDAIGNCELRQATLADCMLELIRCARAMSKMELEENEDAGFLAHAKATFDRRFKLIATPIHWLALFLHPLCRKLAVSDTVHGHSLDFMIETALAIALQWKWSEEKALKLQEDLKRYFQCKAPFAGGAKNAREWWEAIPRDSHEGIRSLAIVLASIVPHSADVEHLFSDLGGIQTPRRSSMAVDTMEKSGKVRSRLNYELYNLARAEGTSKHRNHGHMHTSEKIGIDDELAKDLENPITWIPPLAGNDDEGDENIVEKACKDLEAVINDEEPGPIIAGSVIAGELVNFSELDRLDAGETAGFEEDSIDVVGDGSQSDGITDANYC
ncbi:ribonuclease H-like domain-containing protein [Mycena crocata]|nr:ribonuclease H-like domain-containing protein [Mycena crocata]